MKEEKESITKYKLICNTDSITQDELDKIELLAKNHLTGYFEMNRGCTVVSNEFTGKALDDNGEDYIFYLTQIKNIDNDDYYEGTRIVEEKIEVKINKDFTKYTFAQISTKTLNPYPKLTEKGATELLKNTIGADYHGYKVELTNLNSNENINGIPIDNFFSYRVVHNDGQADRIVRVNKYDYTIMIEAEDHYYYSLAEAYTVYSDEYNSNSQYTEEELKQILIDRYGEETEYTSYYVYSTDATMRINDIKLYPVSMTIVTGGGPKVHDLYIGSDRLIYDYASVHNYTLKVF